MRKEGARDALKKRVASMTEERVAQLVAWMRSKRTGRFRRKQTPLQEFKGNLESMTNREVEEMLEGTLRIPTIPPCCSEGRRPVVPKDSGRVFRVIAATCSE